MPFLVNFFYKFSDISLNFKDFLVVLNKICVFICKNSDIVTNKNTLLDLLPKRAKFIVS